MRHAAVYEEEDFAGNGAELSLGMGTLLGIFFGLALVCGVFFGFGYMMGHRTPAAYISSEPLYVPKPAESPVAPKPSALVPAQPDDSSRVVLTTTTQTNQASTPAPSVQQPRPAQAAETPLVDVPKPTVGSEGCTRTGYDSASDTRPDSGSVERQHHGADRRRQKPH